MLLDDGKVLGDLLGGIEIDVLGKLGQPLDLTGRIGWRIDVNFLAELVVA